VSQGYRKVPGSICTGGMQLTPYVYECSSRGYFASIFSLRGIFVLAVFAAVIYFGWPNIEAILLMMPLPDPKRVIEKTKDVLSRARAYFTRVIPQLAVVNRK